MDNIKELMDFLDRSPSQFHAVENLTAMLEKAGYVRLAEEKSWTVEAGGKYFVTRNGSSVIAFKMPKATPTTFAVAAAHSDSPSFKLKESGEKMSGGYVQLATEKYGGMLMAPWFDRPLSICGRVIYRDGAGLKSKLVNADRDLLVIPSVAIHLNREANNGVKYMANIDTIPLYGTEEVKGTLGDMIGELAGVEKEKILGKDLYLYPRTKSTLMGGAEEFLGSHRIDNLECSWGIMKSFIEAGKTETSGSAIAVAAVFDNEEVGSDTKQGASSNFMRDTLRRAVLALGMSEEDYLRMVASGMMVSADNAHAIHPNHPELSDGDNCPRMNKGIVIKHNADQKYTTDGFSAAAFKLLCEEAQVPVQVYANRSDLPGGSTLGAISNTKVAMMSVDIGLAQLAMHSPFETAGAKDIDYLVKAMTLFFTKTPVKEEAGCSLA